MAQIDLPIRELRRRFADKSLSPLEYWLALEDHIAAWEPQISALYLYDPEAARAQAKASTERWATEQTLGALDGIPVTLKELIATKGQPVPFGTRAVELKPAEADAPAAARLREDGAVIFAKTTCPDYGMLSSGLSSFHPLSRNPWDVTQNPGGSSAGARRRQRPVTGLCISARISAARCGSPPAGPVSSASSRATDAFQPIPIMSGDVSDR